MHLSQREVLPSPHQGEPVECAVEVRSSTPSTLPPPTSLSPHQPSYSFCISHVSGAQNMLSQEEAVVDEQMRAARGRHVPGGPFLPPPHLGPRHFSPSLPKPPLLPAPALSYGLGPKGPPPLPSHAPSSRSCPLPRTRHSGRLHLPRVPAAPGAPPSPSGQRKRTW